jgi:uncharacterized protein
VRSSYTPRIIDPVLAELISGLPAVLIVGPRAVGKTTTARRLAKSELRLDSPPTAAAVEADPDAAIRGLAAPVLVDEWQEAPGVLGAIKRAVDQDSTPGRFLVTGSVRGDLESPTWPGTGRLVRLDMYGLTVAELQGSLGDAPFLDRLADQALDDWQQLSDAPDLRGYVELALRSGFPEPALRLSDRLRERWLDSYLDELMTRDLAGADHRRDPERLRRYVEAVALHTAGVVEHTALYRSASISRTTAEAYDRLLRNLLVAEEVPAWHSSRFKRLTKARKRYLTDPALASSALRLDVNAFMRDAGLLGRLLDTFVTAQIRAEVPACRTRPRLFHLRQADGRHEIDIVVELAGQRVIGIEVKAGAPGPADARHLAWFRDSLGDRFTAGVILHTGPLTYRLGDRIVAAPIASLWS